MKKINESYLETEFSDRDSILKKWYGDYYSTVSVTADGSLFERYLHKSMEAGLRGATYFPRVLEVGGNRGEHIPYVKHRFDEYVLTDLYPPNLLESLRADKRVVSASADVEDLPYEDNSFDRLVSTCVLHHVPDPFRALREMRRVVRPGGRLTILLPTDPSAAYRLAQRVTSGRNARKRGIGEFFELVHAVDHVNHFTSLIQQINYVFRRDDLSCVWRPTRVPLWHLNLFTVLQIDLAR